MYRCYPTIFMTISTLLFKTIKLLNVSLTLLKGHYKICDRFSPIFTPLSYPIKLASHILRTIPLSRKMMRHLLIVFMLKHKCEIIYTSFLSVNDIRYDVVWYNIHDLHCLCFVAGFFLKTISMGNKGTIFCYFQAEHCL